MRSGSVASYHIRSRAGRNCGVRGISEAVQGQEDQFDGHVKIVCRQPVQTTVVLGVMDELTKCRSHRELELTAGRVISARNARVQGNIYFSI
jgi:hypothetical protein